MRVSIRAISRRKVRMREDFSSCALACWSRRLKISWRRFRPSAISSGRVFSWISLRCAFFISVPVTGNKSSLDRQLGRRQTKRFARNSLSHAIHFEKHIGRADHRDPGFERPLAFAHSRFQRFLRKGFLRKHANPHLAVPLHVTRDGYASSLNLLGIEPATLQRHQTILAKRDRVPARGQAGAAAAVHLAVLHSLGHQWHNKIFLKNSRFGFPLARGRHNCTYAGRHFRRSSGLHYWPWLHRALVFLRFAFANPAFHAQLAVYSFRFSKTVINIRAQGVQRDPAPMVLLDPRQLGSPKPACAANL